MIVPFLAEIDARKTNCQLKAVIVGRASKSAFLILLFLRLRMEIRIFFFDMSSSSAAAESGHCGDSLRRKPLTMRRFLDVSRLVAVPLSERDVAPKVG